ncbi:hypothetical protein KIPB_015550, partial [Kipferlia bialata]|eukprot:g15550.t1
MSNSQVSKNKARNKAGEDKRSALLRHRALKGKTPAKRITLQLVILSAVLSLSLSLLAGVSLMYFVLHHAGRVNARYLFAEGILSDHLTVESLSGVGGRVSVGSDLEVPAVFSLSNSPPLSGRANTDVSGREGETDTYSSMRGTGSRSSTEGEYPSHSTSTSDAKDTPPGASTITMEGGALTFIADTVAF